ncbi:MAG: glycosyltransferase family 4 protein [Methanothrix sp.]
MPNGETTLLWLNHRDIMHRMSGGAERSIAEIGSRLSRMGFSVNLYSVNDGTLKDSDYFKGIKIHRARSNIAAHISVPRVIRSVKPDVIIDDMAHAVPWFSSVFSNIPVVVYFRHMHARTIYGQLPFPQASAIKLIEKMYGKIYRDSTFVTESNSSEADLARLGIPKERIRIILPGVDHKRFKPTLKSENPSMIYFSGMRDYKRPWLAVSALSEARKKTPGVTLNVVGKGPSVQKVTEFAKAEKKKSIIFHGRVAEKSLPQLISESWVNLNFSVAEGFGYSILEAASCGTPTIALDAYGVTETVEKYGFGKVISSMEEFGDAYSSIIENIEKYAKDVRKRSMKFSWERCANEWAKLLRRAAYEGNKRNK